MIFVIFRMRFIIYEEADLYIKDNQNAMREFVRMVRAICGSCQLLLSGSKWLLEMEEFYAERRKDPAPAIMISGANQVLQYARIKWKVHYVGDEDKKLDQLTAVLKTCLDEHKHVVVACSTPDIAKLVFENLESSLCQFGQVFLGTLETSQLRMDGTSYVVNHFHVFIIYEKCLCYNLSCHSYFCYS